MRKNNQTFAFGLMSEVIELVKSIATKFEETNNGVDFFLRYNNGVPFIRIVIYSLPGIDSAMVNGHPRKVARKLIPFLESILK